MDRHLPIAVIGAGPAGSSAALCLKRAGFERVVLFEKRAWPRPKACAGGLGPKALSWLKKAGLFEAVSARAVAIEGLYFTGPTQKRQMLPTPGQVARVMERARFDAFMVDQAVAAGAEFRPGIAVAAVERSASGVVVKAAGGPAEFTAVVVACGASQLDGVKKPAHRTVSSVMARYQGFPHEPGAMEMIFTAEVSPYYAWLFPEPGGAVNLGLVVDRKPGDASLHKLFDHMLERYFGPRVAQASLVGKRFGAPLHVCTHIGEVARDRVLLVGESAGLVNAATGEGIPWGLESGELAAQVLAGREPNELARAHRRAMQLRFEARLFAAERARQFIGSFLFGPFSRMGNLPGMQPLLARMFAKV